MDARTRGFRHGLALPAFVALAALGSASAWAAGPDTLQQKVTDQLKKAGLEKKGQVTVDVAGTLVTLNGFVTTVAADREALKAAHKVSPNVEDQLRVMPEAERTDAEITKDLQKAILRYPRYTIFDNVGVGVDRGLVRIEGSVLQPYRKDDIESIIAQVPGVRGIENNLTVQRVSISDADLRRYLAKAIYRNTLFDRYAIQPNPPIHIVVDGGRVTLTGFVATPLEQAVLGHIARQSMAFSVDNQVQVDGQTVDHKPEPPATN
jgi:hyperosmotically inducible protein